MDTKLDFKIQTDKQLEVIGQGKMITTPCQVGEWWVTPAQDYKGKIPPEIQRKMFEFLNQGVEIQGFLIAEDMKEIEAKRELEEKKIEARRQAVKDTAEGFMAVMRVTGQILLVLIALPFMAFDPMLICVLPPDEEDIANGTGGKWICIGTWYD